MVLWDLGMLKMMVLIEHLRLLYLAVDVVCFAVKKKRGGAAFYSSLGENDGNNS